MQKKVCPQVAVTVSRACRVLEVSRSGYYAKVAAHKQRLTEPMMCAVSIHLKAAFAASHKAYGCGRLTTVMAARGLAMGRHRVSTLMRLNGLRPIWRRKFVHTTDSKHSMAVSANVLNRQFEQALPNVIWVCDITYIREIRLAVFGGSAGLAFVQDCGLGHGRCDACNTSVCAVAYGHRSKKSCN